MSLNLGVGTAQAYNPQVHGRAGRIQSLCPWKGRSQACSCWCSFLRSDHVRFLQVIRLEQEVSVVEGLLGLGGGEQVEDGPSQALY